MINAEKILGFNPGPQAVNYSGNDCILYALSIGIGMDPADPAQLPFVYERDLKAFPAMASVLGWPGRLTDPAYGIDNRKVVASDLDVQWHQPLATQAALTARARVSHVFDKGPGEAAIIRFERVLAGADGTPVATIRNSILARGQGGFGGTADGLEKPHAVPDGNPGLTCDLKTAPNIALLFRLQGDTNPIHVDPDLARKAGMPVPILHGAASFGIAAHALLRTVPGATPERFARMQARFAKPFYPGETLRTEIWVQGDRISFRCRSAERNEVTLDNGLLELSPL